MDSIEEARQLLKAHQLEHPEIGMEDAITYLQQLGHSKIDCIGAVSEAFGTTHSEAKRVVHLSPTWEFRRESDEAFHDALFSEPDSNNEY